MSENEEIDAARKVIQAVAAQLGEPVTNALKALMGAYARGKEDGKKAALDEQIVVSVHTTTESREVWGYASSEDCESWEGVCKSRDEAITEGRSEFGDQGFWVMRGTRPDPAKYVPHIDTILDHMSEDAGEEGGEAAEDYPDVTDEGREALGMLLRAWARQYARPTFWVADGFAEYITMPERTPCPMCATMTVDNLSCSTCGHALTKPDAAS